MPTSTGFVFWAALLYVLLAGPLRQATAACYFPAELQGDFVMQSTVTAGGGQVQYSALNISADSIPIWGHCHRRIGTNVLLMDDSGGAICIRCFHLSLRSRNVLSVLTEGLDKCYTSEEAAVCSCPEERRNALPQCPEVPRPEAQGVKPHFREMLLFKTSGLAGEVIRSEYCPLDGRFAFSYTTEDTSDGRRRQALCQRHDSQMENCPVGSGLHFRFRGCAHADHNITFQCLGHWPGPNNQRYLALSEASSTTKTRARYRCALYQEDAATGVISMAFSSDSTCSSDLRSATDGFETLKLTPQGPLHWPQPLDPSPCLFAKWAQGHWEHMAVEGNTLVFRDHRTFTTYTLRCLSTEDATGERALIFGRTQCGEEIYSCIWMKLRGVNVLEFQLGLRSSAYLNESLCVDSNFRDDAWITQGRVEVLRESPCPIAGEYTGFIPDDSGLCAKLYSDCNRPEIMFYRVSACTAEPEVYEGTGRDVPFNSNHWPRKFYNPSQVGSGIFHIADSRAREKPNMETLISSVAPNFRTSPWQGDLFPVSTERPTFPDVSIFPNHPQSYLQSNQRPLASIRSQFQHGYLTQPSHLIRHLMPPQPITNYNSSYMGKKIGFTQSRERTKRMAKPSDSMEFEDFETEYDPWTFPKNHGHKAPKETTTEKTTSIPFMGPQSPGSFPPLTKFIPRYFPPLPTPPPRLPLPDIIRNHPRPLPNPALEGSVSIPCSQNVAIPFNSPSSWASPGVHQGQPRRCIHSSSSRDPRHPDATARRMEEREYRCLGQWEEDGVMYTYTQRRDIGSYECFVGSIVTNSEIYIKEAGEHCQRNVNPLLDGMKLSKRGSCQSPQENSGTSTFSPTRPYPTSPWHSSKKTSLPTRPWKPITGSPKGQEGIQNAVHRNVVNVFSFLCIVTLTAFL